MQLDSREEARETLNNVEIRRCWERNAEAWTLLAREGYDIYRNHVNTPGFLRMLPEVKNLRGLDIGCGEGYNTRKVAERGADMTAIDISQRFTVHAHHVERENPKHVSYLQATGNRLPFGDGVFDFCMATMSLMDMPDHETVLCEVYRVLRRGGFFQFSISHPCFMTRRFGWVRDEGGNKTAVTCGDYFNPLNGEIEEWIFGAAPEELKRRFEKFKIPTYDRTLSGWLNLLIRSGFTLEAFDEPYATEETIREFPHLLDTRIFAYFLIIRCSK